MYRRTGDCNPATAQLPSRDPLTALTRSHYSYVATPWLKDAHLEWRKCRVLGRDLEVLAPEGPRPGIDEWNPPRCIEELRPGH